MHLHGALGTQVTTPAFIREPCGVFVVVAKIKTRAINCTLQ